MRYIQYIDFLNNYNDYKIEENIGNIFVGKINKSYLVGPLVTNDDTFKTLFKRIKSNCIYDISKYKRVSDKVAKELLNKYQSQIKDNKIIEITNHDIKIHRMLNIPEDKYEE